MDEPISEYAMSVRARIKARNGDLFENFNPIHARLIIKEFLRASQNYVRVFCGKLNSRVYGELKQDFLAALERGVIVQTLIAEEKPESTELAYLLREEDSIRRIKRDADIRGIPHFVICDGKMYRLETHEGKTSALVCAYSPADESTRRMSAAMENTFDVLWREKSEPIPA